MKVNLQNNNKERNKSHKQMNHSDNNKENKYKRTNNKESNKQTIEKIKNETKIKYQWKLNKYQLTPKIIKQQWAIKPKKRPSKIEIK